MKRLALVSVAALSLLAAATPAAALADTGTPLWHVAVSVPPSGDQAQVQTDLAAAVQGHDWAYNVCGVGLSGYAAGDACNGGNQWTGGYCGSCTFQTVFGSDLDPGDGGGEYSDGLAYFSVSIAATNPAATATVAVPYDLATDTFTPGIYTSSAGGSGGGSGGVSMADLAPYLNNLHDDIFFLVGAVLGAALIPLIVRWFTGGRD